MLKKNNNYIIFGVITKQHGIKGELRLLPFFQDTSTFYKAKEVTLIKNNDIRTFRVCSARPHAKFILIKLESINSIEDAIPLINSEVGISNEYVPPLEKDEFYVEDLIGMKALDSENSFSGTVKDVFTTPSNDVYEITNDDTGEEILVPGTKEYIHKIDFENKEIRIKLPKYL
ncbi:MAG: 16S rRNA processing protein RimM [Candidatus Margulisiibacteriota bacterium]|nr:MAG: 16S rRNA processing protein RimM [Candidatus Margulisbacteria bacterium GWD2_39_127]OGI03056.1 MAG: 16S rRNA processing protein RimM [Candidatus Margulisbacteria bacterium GWF2_38_17]OGI11615.1 MAG: 16S rRNA processing protein RimM [Candidatus Margulisbacteria bacterium GWE2_39_32]PZM79923.1 MAG: 16S rRNA processing protein RimM [Candidatus Margulisiibacteriota bacterium]HAR62841.1 16S rRNA processing protein RimM [Candidatus Margulisiibacteriota bacterium]